MMCAEYDVHTTQKAIDEALGAPTLNRGLIDSWQTNIKFTNSAPVVQLSGENLEITEKVFPAQPFPNARLSGVDSDLDGDQPADEVQLKRIYQLNTWKEGFKNHPFLIPMTGFREPAYWGEFAGSVLQFELPKGSLFFAAGIAINSRVPKTEPLGAFAILTHTATPQMWESHHRLVVLFQPKDALGYLEAENHEARFEYILKHRFTEPLDRKLNRKMAKKWEGRINVQNVKRLREEKYLALLEQEGIEG